MDQKLKARTHRFGPTRHRQIMMANFLVNEAVLEAYFQKILYFYNMNTILKIKKLK